MRNRAKCKLCGSVIESFTIEDYVMCACEEIAISGGLVNLQCFAKDFKNFMRIDDNGNEILVSVKEKEDVKPLDIGSKPTKEELLKMLEELIKSYEKLPQKAMMTPVLHADVVSLMILLLEIMRTND